MNERKNMTPEDFLVDFMLRYEIDPDDVKRAYVARMTYKAMTEKDPEEEAWLAKHMTKRVQIEVTDGEK
jgi:hypothetical protein